MCLILFSFKQHPLYPLVIAANRDEFYDRASAPAAFWEDAPDLLAGRDLVAGGTWLGITRSGRLAALTNYRDPRSSREDAPSRGMLVAGYLRGRETPEAFLEKLSKETRSYNGFSLVLGDAGTLYYFSNRNECSCELKPGLYGLSNRFLDTAWPKVERGKKALAELLASERDPAPEELFRILADECRPEDNRLPDTGVGIEWERLLSPLFIKSPTYGTRSSTVLLINKEGIVTFVERTFNSNPNPLKTVAYEFRIRSTGEGDRDRS